MEKKKYAVRKAVINDERLKRYYDKVAEFYSDAESYVYGDLLPRLEKERKEVAHMRYRLQERENKLEKLESELSAFLMEDDINFSDVYDYINTFESRLTDEQITRLLPVINKYVFTDIQTVESVHEWLACENEKPVRVKDLSQLCFLLNLLRENDYICRNAQTVAEENKTFVGRRGKIVTQRSLTTSLSKKFVDINGHRKDGIQIRDGMYILNQEMLDAVEALAGVKD